jgi:hypothetical protein
MPQLAIKAILVLAATPTGGFCPAMSPNFSRRRRNLRVMQPQRSKPNEFDLTGRNPALNGTFHRIIIPASSSLRFSDGQVSLSIRRTHRHLGALAAQAGQGNGRDRRYQLFEPGLGSNDAHPVSAYPQ